MISPVVKPEEWAARYGITWKDAYCLKCGRKVEFKTPFAHGSFRGLISEIHRSCGEEFQQSIFVTVDPETNKALSSS